VTAAFIFDLDGTLVDNVYAHVAAWKKAFEEAEIQTPTWRIHRRIGMSGRELVSEIALQAHTALSADAAERVHARHGEIFAALKLEAEPLPGARELLSLLSARSIGWAIATSGRPETARAALDALQVDLARAIIVTSAQVKDAKPAPDLFLEAARRLQREARETVVVGDSVWDMEAARRAGARGVGLRSGGYGRDELESAGAAYVFDDPAELMAHLAQLTALG
jgi:HAD superfamily hydrolase (TIGR01509 family)